MHQLASIQKPSNGHLPSLIDRASRALAGARSSAEILEAKALASIAYDAAKLAARLAKAKTAHDDLVAAAHRAQADALEIEAQAKRRLADEYDAAQERGEVVGPSDRHSSSRAELNKATASDLGLSRKDIHEARLIRDAEKANPGIVRRTLKEQLERGDEPTKAEMRRVITEAAMKGLRGSSAGRGKRPTNELYRPPSEAEKAWQHLYGTARAIVEWGTVSNINLAIKGMQVQADTSEANIRAVQKCAAIFNSISERLKC